jgi:hypothetical protein
MSIRQAYDIKRDPLLVPDGTLNLPLVGQGAGVSPAYTALTPAGLSVEDHIAWHIFKGTPQNFLPEEGVWDWIVCHPTSYADKGIQAYGGQNNTGAYPIVFGRATAYNNSYSLWFFPGVTTADFLIYKRIAGTTTALATEAVDLNVDYGRTVKLECVGTTLKGYRTDMTTPKISATDTAIASGYFGVGSGHGSPTVYEWARFVTAKIVTPASPSPKVLGWYEVPVVGAGTNEDPYRADLPAILETASLEELEKYPAIKANRGGLVNRIAVSHASLIPTDPTSGKPLNPTCIVRIFEQPDRQPHLWKIAEAIDKIETIPAVKKLDATQAKLRAKELDKKLTDKDLEDW